MTEATHDVVLSIPDSVSVTLRGHERTLDTNTIPNNVLVWLLTDKGMQRAANDPLGAVFDKGYKPKPEEIDSYWNDVLKRWQAGETAKARKGGLGRTTDPVQREMKRLAKDEVLKSVAKLLAFHKVSRKEFDEQFLAKYVKARVEKFHDRLEEEAKAYLEKVAASTEEDDVDLLDIDDVADESADADESAEPDVPADAPAE